MFRIRPIRAFALIVAFSSLSLVASAQSHVVNFDALPSGTHWGVSNGVAPGSFLFQESGIDFFITNPYPFYWGVNVDPAYAIGGGNYLYMVFAGVVWKVNPSNEVSFKFSSGYEGTFEVNGMPLGFNVEDIAGLGTVFVPLGSLVVEIWSVFDPRTGLTIGQATVHGKGNIEKVHWMGIEFAVDSVFVD